MARPKKSERGARNDTPPGWLAIYPLTETTPPPEQSGEAPAIFVSGVSWSMVLGRTEIASFGLHPTTDDVDGGTVAVAWMLLKPAATPYLLRIVRVSRTLLARHAHHWRVIKHGYPVGRSDVQRLLTLLGFVSSDDEPSVDDKGQVYCWVEFRGGGSHAVH